MNRILPLLLCCLLLCGCGIRTSVIPDNVSVPTETPALPTPQKPKALAPIQTQYDGALQIFSPGIQDATGLFPLGDHLLILSGRENTTLTLLSGDTLVPLATVTLPFLLEPGDPSLRFGAGFLSYFDPMERETVVLDGSLREVSHIPAPEDLQGVPLLSEDRNALYYCTADGIRVWNLETGLRRQLKEMAFPGQTLTGLSMDVLTCLIPDGAKSRSTCLSTRTGGLLYEVPGDLCLTSQEGWYCAVLPIGLGQVLVCGEEGGSPMLFLPETIPEQCFLLRHQPGAVTCTGQNRMEHYNFLSGKRDSALTLDGDLTPIAAADTPTGDLFLLAEKESTNTCVLCRWEVNDGNALALREDTGFLFPYQTREDPAALAQCEAYASELSARFGIHILVGQSAVQAPPRDYTLEPETQPGILLRELQNLETRLSQFPEGFWQDTASHFTSVKLCIVRSVTGTAASRNQEPATGVQFLDGTDAYVVITAGKFSEQALYRELFHVMETHILTGSSALDQWSKLNPQEFSYTYGASAAPKGAEIWLSGENRAFIDFRSQSLPREDRSRIFEAALLPGNQETFQPWILQRKLTAICQGIREAYGLTKSTQTYPWEQYLIASLAYPK